MDVTIYSAESKALTEEEILAYEENSKKIRKEEKFFRRFHPWVLDIAFLRAARKGASVEHAGRAAAVSYGMVGGGIFGCFVTLMTVGTISWFVGLFATLSTINACVIIFGWIVILVVTIKTIRDRLAKWLSPVTLRVKKRLSPIAVKAKGKFTRKPKEAS